MGKSHTIWDHSVTCHPAEVRIPPLPPSDAGTRFSDPGWCKAELTYVTWKRTGWELNLWRVNCKSDAVPQGHHATKWSRYRHSYYWRLIGIFKHSVKWCYLQSSWVARKCPNPLRFQLFVSRLSYLRNLKNVTHFELFGPQSYLCNGLKLIKFHILVGYIKC